MESLLRVGAAAINAGQPSVAAMLWRDLDEDDGLTQLITGNRGTAVVIGDHTLSLGTQPQGDMVTVDGHICSVEDLTLNELIDGVEAIATESGSLSHEIEGLDRLAASLSDELSITRFRLLLEDVLFDPRARPVAMDRLEQWHSRHQRRDRDVEGLFDT